MGLLGTVTSEEYTEALKPPAPPAPFAKGTEVAVEVISISEEKISTKEGNHPYHWVNLKLTSDSGEHRYADTVFSLSPKAKGMNIQFLSSLGLGTEAISNLNSLEEIVGACGRGVCGEPRSYTAQDGSERQKTTLGRMKPLN